MTTLDPLDDFMKGLSDEPANDAVSADVIAFPIDTLVKFVSEYHASAQNAGLDGVFVVMRLCPARHKGESPSPRLRHFRVGDVKAMTKFVKETPRNQNVYLKPAVFRKDMKPSSSGTLDEIVGLCGLVLEEDAGKPVTWPSVEPTFVIETSPGNSHHHWVFKRALKGKDAAIALCQLAYNRCGGDSCNQDASHFWRLPETWNNPDWKKVGRGRSPEPFAVNLQGVAGRALDAKRVRSALTSMPEAKPVTKAPKPSTEVERPPRDTDAIRASLPQVLLDKLDMETDEKGGDRSTWCHHVIRLLFEQGCNRAEVEGLALEHSFADKFAGRDDGGRALDAEIERGWIVHKREAVDFGEDEALTEAPAKSGFEPFDVGLLLKEPAPEREWFVEGVIPANEVTLLAGDGGTGKSTIALQLALAAALNTPWLDHPVACAKSLILSAEDDRCEMHYRLEKMVDGMMPGDRDTNRKTLETQVFVIDASSGLDPALATFDAKTKAVKGTALLRDIAAFIQEHNIGLFIADSAANVFTEEIDRAGVASFIRTLRSLGCTVLLLGHPSIDGMKSGRGHSGSTHWNNAVRSRLYLTRSDGKKGTASADIRELQIAKSNRGRSGETITLRWTLSGFVNKGRDALETESRKHEADDEFLKLLRECERKGQNVCAALNSTNYAPKMFSGKTETDFSKPELEGALNRLLDCGTLHIVQKGPPSKKINVIKIKEASSPQSQCDFPTPFQLPGRVPTPRGV